MEQLETIRAQLADLLSIAAAKLEGACAIEELEAIRVETLGKKGQLTTILRGLGALPAQERPRVGQEANRVKQELESLLAARQGVLKDQEQRRRLAEEKIDITLPGMETVPGRLHPITIIRRQVEQIFIGLGFRALTGPIVETDYYNFEALNIPADHPSRDMWDSFYLAPGRLLRSHTSPMQVRVMEKQPPPVRIITSGRCFRRDAVDATHHWMFHQVEGLLVDETTTFGDLKGVLEAFAREMFGATRRARFIPSYFPFTEPSVEMTIDCFACQGQGCGICKHSGWIEILGAGMVNPRVLAGVGYDAEKYQGFAFGIGLERIAMLRYGINDIRLFFENDRRFLVQFQN